MSYDLLFTCDPPPHREDFLAYFTDRRWYTINGNQAFYQNDDTGVYFSFDYPGDAEEDMLDEEGEEPTDGTTLDDLDDDDLELGDVAGESAGDEEGSTLVSFNINFFRPHYFGLEAAGELREFVNHFGFAVIDPQGEGMGEGVFSEEGFLRGWNAGNQFGFRAILHQEDSEDFTQGVLQLPTEQLQRIWQWNHTRAEHAAEAADAAWVPRIMFLKIEGEPKTCCLWIDAWPVHLPQVDYVLMVREQLAVEGVEEGQQGEMCLAPWSEVEPLVERCEPEYLPMPFYRLEYDEPPYQVLATFQAQQITSLDGLGVPNNQVLNAELLDQGHAREGG